MRRVAAVDIGTNSARLLVADTEGPSEPITTVERIARITRLGQGVDARRELHPDAIERTLDVLAEFRRVMDRLGVVAVRATATSAARDAGNREDFFAPATEVLAATPELLSGEEEAALSFAGATAQIDAPAPYLIVDVGGGSTEFVAGFDAPEGLVSIDIGCVRLTERFLAGDPPAPEELTNALTFVRDHLADVDKLIPGAAEAATVVGLAGTLTTMAAVEMGLAVYDADLIHHFSLTRDAAEDVFRTLATEPAEQRRHNPGLEPGRVDVIVGGAIVVVAMMRHWDLDRILVSESDILDGLVLSIA